MDIILYLLHTIQDLYRQNCWLIQFICRYIPLKQWAFEDWRLLIPYFEHRYNIKIKPIARRKECSIPDDCTCPFCNAPKPYLYSNNGDKGQILCKVCETTFSPQENRFSKLTTLASGKDSVSCNQLEKFDKQYDEIIKTACAENPLPETADKKRGRKKKGKVLNLIGNRSGLRLPGLNVR